MDASQENREGLDWARACLELAAVVRQDDRPVAPVASQPAAGQPETAAAGSKPAAGSPSSKSRGAGKAASASRKRGAAAAPAVEPPDRAAPASAAESAAAPTVRASQPAPAASPCSALDELGRCFGLGKEELAILQLLLAIETSTEHARAAQTLSGGRGPTVTLLGSVLGIDLGRVLELLATQARLRSHGLVVLDGVPGGLPEPGACLRLGAGLATRLLGRSFTPAELGPGSEWIEPDNPIATPEVLARLVRDELVDMRPRWVTISAAQAGDGRAMAGALARRLRRPCLLLDGGELARLSAAMTHGLLAAYRREADLRGAPLLLQPTSTVGGGWQALAARPAAASPAASLIVLLDEASSGATRPPAGFVARDLVFGDPDAGQVGAVRDVVPAPAPEPSPAADGFEAARRQAAIDAARALGRPLPTDPTSLPSKCVVPRAAAMATPPLAAAVATPPLDVPAAEKQEDALRRAAARVSPTEAGGRAAPTTTAAASALTAEAAVTAGAPAAQVATVAQATAAVPMPPADAAREAPQAAPALGDTQAGGEALAPTVPDAAEQLPFIDVPPGIAAAEVLKLIPQAGNPLQRAELLRQLAQGSSREMQVVAMLRAHTRVDHPAVRAAAEEGMTKLFGPKWNSGRPITKPVQPPRSDDSDTGPPGGRW